MSENTVELDKHGCLYVEVDGTRYYSDDLPAPGTFVTVSLQLNRTVDLWYSADTPSGQAFVRAESNPWT